MEQQWMSHYDILKLDVQNKRKTGLPITRNEISSFSEALKILEKNLKIIQDSPMEYEISSSEISRRIIILENLRKQIGLINASDVKLTRSSLGQNETANPLTMSDRGLIQRQQEVIQQQDLMLGQIEKGVDRLHSQAMEIGQEAKIHNKILDDLDRHVDIATEGLREETKHAEQIRRKSQVCYMYICIVIEVVILLILVILAFTKV